jgi:hypothetical protein
MREVGAGCFAYCESLSIVTFGMGSQLARIEAGTFTGSSQAQVILPNGEEVFAQEFEQE